MRVIIANSAGFLHGGQAGNEQGLPDPEKRKGPIFTYGPLIHNPQVVRLLTEKGVSAVSSDQA